MFGSYNQLSVKIGEIFQKNAVNQSPKEGKQKCTIKSAEFLQLTMSVLYDNASLGD